MLLEILKKFSVNAVPGLRLNFFTILSPNFVKEA